LAQSLHDGVVEKKPWYEPSKKLPNSAIISKALNSDFDSLVVDLPAPARL
jgi:hypothetical protein